MESSTIFCQKNILEHSLSFFGAYEKICLLTMRVSQILSLTRQMPICLSTESDEKMFMLKYEGSNEFG